MTWRDGESPHDGIRNLSKCVINTLTTMANTMVISDMTATRMAVIADRTQNLLVAGAKAMMIENLKSKLTISEFEHTLLPVPVAPAISPCLFAIEGSRYTLLSPVPSQILCRSF